MPVQSVGVVEPVKQSAAERHNPLAVSVHGSARVVMNIDHALRSAPLRPGFSGLL